MNKEEMKRMLRVDYLLANYILKAVKDGLAASEEDEVLQYKIRNLINFYFDCYEDYLFVEEYPYPQFVVGYKLTNEDRMRLLEEKEFDHSPERIAKILNKKESYYE